MIENFFSEAFDTPTGRMHIITDEEQKLRAADWENKADRRPMGLLTERSARESPAGTGMLQWLRTHYGENGFRLAETRTPSEPRLALEAYFEGQVAAIESIRTLARGTEFQLLVWSALRAIPVGSTLSYGALAAKIGRPAAVRAVGAANGANPIPVVVPCHRVIGADSSLTGFGGGLERKRWLLTHERTHATSSVPYNLELRI